MSREHSDWRTGSRRGERVDQDMPPVLEGLREGQHFRSQDAPRGVWGFSGSKGLALTQHFDEEQVEHVWLCGDPEDLGDLEVELWGHRRTLQPGASLTLSQEIEIRSISLDR